MSTCINEKQIEEIYAKREAAIEHLANIHSISSVDIVHLDRLGRYTVARDLWHKCDRSARAVLISK